MGDLSLARRAAQRALALQPHRRRVAARLRAATWRQQGFDWQQQFAIFRYTGKVSKDDAKLNTHGVNNAMALKTSGLWWLVTGDADDRRAVDRQLAHAWTAITCCRTACTAATSTMPAPTRRRAPSCARWSRACSRSSISSPSSAIPRSATGWRRSPSTRCRGPSTATCGRISTISSRTRSSAACGSAIVDDQRARLEPLRPRAELRLLHRQHAPGLAEVRREPVDGDPGRRPGRGRVRPERGDDHRSRQRGRHADRGHRVSVPRSGRHRRVPGARGGVPAAGPRPGLGDRRRDRRERRAAGERPAEHVPPDRAHLEARRPRHASPADGRPGDAMVQRLDRARARTAGLRAAHRRGLAAR